MIPEALREPNFLDHTLEELVFSCGKNRKVKVYSTVAKLNREAEIVRNRAEDDSPKSLNTKYS